jgi:DNA-directed RNA polymerase specialized sigma24 family protein
MGTCNPHLSILTPASQFAAAYRGHFHQTVNYLRGSGSNAERAEEIAQAAWARGWECREQLRARLRRPNPGSAPSPVTSATWTS